MSGKFVTIIDPDTDYYGWCGQVLAEDEDEDCLLVKFPDKPPMRGDGIREKTPCVPFHPSQVKEEAFKDLTAGFPIPLWVGMNAVTKPLK